MRRRFFLAAALASAVAAPALAGSNIIDFEPGVVQEALDSGKTVFLEYSAVWCGTCKRQERVVDALRETNPKYDEAMVFVRVDWDNYRKHKITLGNKVPRRSTLVILRGEDEVGRLVSETREDRIKALLDKGLLGGA